MRVEVLGGVERRRRWSRDDKMRIIEETLSFSAVGSPETVRRALEARDGGCRFPGCSHARYVDAHHIKHWADGGETTLDNLILLCRRHHRLLHEAGFTIHGHPGGELEFRRPDRRWIPESPVPPGGTASALLRHEHRGVRGSGEPPPRLLTGSGERMHLGYAMDAMFAIL